MGRWRLIRSATDRGVVVWDSATRKPLWQHKPLVKPTPAPYLALAYRELARQCEEGPGWAGFGPELDEAGAAYVFTR